MVSVVFDQYTGMSPIEGDDTPSNTRALTCFASLRKRDIRPYFLPEPIGETAALTTTRLLENPITQTIHGGQLGDSFVTNGWYGTDVSYAVLNGVAGYYVGDVRTLDFTPIAATTAPTVRYVANDSPASTDTFADKLATVAAAETPVNKTGVAEPSYIYGIKLQGSSSGAVNYSQSDIEAAINYVLDTYTFYYISGTVPFTLRYNLDTMVALLSTTPTLKRTSGSTTYTVPWSANLEDSLRRNIQHLCAFVGAWAVYELTGVVTSNLTAGDVVPCCAEEMSGTLVVIPWVNVNLSARNTYTPVASGGITVDFNPSVVTTWTHRGIVGCLDYAGSVWQNEGFSSPAAAFSAALTEAATCHANYESYIWTGLTSSSIGTRGDLSEYVLGTETLRSGNSTTTSPVPRAYCYTYVDTGGREGTPSEPVVCLEVAEGGVTTHFLTLPAVPDNVYAVKIYRQLLPVSASQDTLPVWTLVSTVYDNFDAEIEIPDVGMIGYDVLSTVYDAYVDSPRWLVNTSTDHTACLDATGKTVYISARHKPYVFPYDRRITLPDNVTAVSMVAVGNQLHVGTTGAPLIITIGEDKGEQGLQIDDTFIRHAPFAVAKPNTHVPTPFGSIYWSNVGVVLVAANNAAVISAALLDEDQVPDYIGDCAVYHNGMYYSWRSDVGVIFDIPDNTFAEKVQAPMTMVDYGVAAATVSYDNKLYLRRSSEASIKQWVDKGTALPIRYRTASQVLPKPVVLTIASVMGHKVDGVLRCYDAEDDLLWAVHIRDNKSVRTPRIRAQHSISLEFEGYADRISRISLASSLLDLQ